LLAQALAAMFAADISDWGAAVDAVALPFSHAL
jgi:hypothetical protein